MCSLCGILAGRGHWTESATNPEVFAGRSEVHTVARERQHRARILNVVLAPYGLSVSDWAASRYLLRSRTGRSALAGNLNELWAEAEKMLGRPCDPLDPGYLSDLSPARQAGPESLEGR